jgi:trimethylamine--corrinoid protein Co-methyltransferase
VTKLGLRHRLEVIGPEDYERIHNASLKILQETGIVIQSEEALAVCRHKGAKVSGETVYFTPKMVNDALKLCKDKYKWQARNNAHSVTVGDGFLVQPNAGPVYIQDLDKGRRLATIEDYANIMKLCQASNVVSLVGAHPVNPSDVEDGEKHLHMMFQILKNTDKPVLGYVSGGWQARQMLDMLEIAFGRKDFLMENHCAGVSVNPLSPLGWVTDAVETLMEYAKRNQAVFLLPCIMAVMSGPMSLLGTVVLQNTEILSGIVLTKLINPSAPVVYSPSSSVANMKKASYITGTPEGMLINIANLQMALNYYHLPTRTMCGMTDAKTVDCQAGYETMQNIMMGMLGGAHIIVECLGVLDAIMTTSYEKFIIDEEIIDRVIRIERGIDTSEEALATEIIQEVGHNGTYLTHPSTFEHFRESWRPTVSDWDLYQDWQESGAEDVVTRANKRYKQILASAPSSLLDPEVEAELLSYMNRVKKL